MLSDHSTISFVSAVHNFYTSNNTNFFWNFAENCTNEISVEYPNLLIEKCSFLSTNEKKSVQWDIPISIETVTKVNFVISFDKSISSDNCYFKYNFKNINNISGNIKLYNPDNNYYSTNDTLTITSVDRIGWYDIIFEFQITNGLCNLEGFDYCIKLDGDVNSYIKNKCHKSNCNKIKINYSSYITFEKVI
jgi:hypothetical protein